MSFKEYASAEWTYWMKEMTAGRHTPDWFKKNLSTIHDTVEAYARDEAVERGKSLIATATAKLISAESARKELGLLEEDSPEVWTPPSTKPAPISGYVGMFDDLPESES
jgi:hypothetical protein